jgi:MFS family permease
MRQATARLSCDRGARTRACRALMPPARTTNLAIPMPFKMYNSPMSSPAPTPVREQQAYPPAGYAWYVVGVLTFVYVFSFIDRQILSLLVKPIREDLGISDFQMSLLMGFTFAVFYTFFGIPLGRLADSRSRRAIIAAGFAVWSLFTAGCGFIRSYTNLLLCRIGVGVGEASLSPSAYSMITDYFPPQRRATALGVYGMGIYIGSGLAMLLGGVVIGLASANAAYTLPLVGAIKPWQMVFFAVGLPGLPLALLLYSVREPVRRGMPKGVVTGERIPLPRVIAYMKENAATILCHTFGFGMISFGTYGAGNWLPTYFQRKLGWSASWSGIVFGVIIITCGSFGVAAGGRLADWLDERGYRDSKLRVAWLASLLNLPCVLAIYLAPNNAIMIAGLIPSITLTAMPFGVAPAAIQQFMPNPMRAQASAVYLFINNMVGLGLGPSAVALLTQYVFKDDKAVGYSLLIVSLISVAASGTLLYFGMRHFLVSLERLKKWNVDHA